MIYLDNAATTPIFKEALDVYNEVSLHDFGNSESNHFIGHSASKILEGARQSILANLGVSKTHNLIFTSGATEANNLALKGSAIRYHNRGNKILSSNIEHPSVTNPLKELASIMGFDVSFLPVNGEGLLTPEVLSQSLNNKTILVSIMAINNEIGSINDISALSSCVHKFPKAIFHVDATQAMGKVNLPYSSIDLLSCSAHKFGGPKGTGFLLYRKNLSFSPLNAGGEQENGFRAGTVDVASMAAMSKALEISLSKQKEFATMASSLYDELYNYLLSLPSQVEINSRPLSASQSPFVLNFSLLKKKASVVVEALSNKGIYVSSVSACSSKEAARSDVVLSLGKSEDLAENSIRVSFGVHNTMADIKEFERAFTEILKEINDR
jgi:cysteine desulfurase